MKHFFKTGLSILIFGFALTGFITVHSLVTAQDSAEESTLGTQIEKLANAIQAFADALQPKSQENFEQSAEYGTSSGNIYKYDFPLCTIDYLKWESSNTRNPETPWSMHGFQANPNSQYINTFFSDINGDGLMDYVHNKTQSGTASKNISGGYEITYFTKEESCVYLNNGNGWDLVYKCKSNNESDGNGGTLPVYYGDCAAL